MNIDLLKVIERRYSIRFDDMFDIILAAWEIPSEIKGKSKTSSHRYTNSIKALGP